MKRALTPGNASGSRRERRNRARRERRERDRAHTPSPLLQEFNCRPRLFTGAQQRRGRARDRERAYIPSAAVLADIVSAGGESGGSGVC
jgi:hypothetical protein